MQRKYDNDAVTVENRQIVEHDGLYLVGDGFDGTDALRRSDKKNWMNFLNENFVMLNKKITDQSPQSGSQAIAPEVVVLRPSEEVIVDGVILSIQEYKTDYSDFFPTDGSKQSEFMEIVGSRGYNLSTYGLVFNPVNETPVGLGNPTYFDFQVKKDFTATGFIIKADQSPFFDICRVYLSPQIPINTSFIINCDIPVSINYGGDNFLSFAEPFEFKAGVTYYTALKSSGAKFRTFRLVGLSPEFLAEPLSSELRVFPCEKGAVMKNISATPSRFQVIKLAV